MATHARPLDRLRFEVLFDDRDPEPLLACLEGYRNEDGGYGYGLEPDLRSRTSQPGGALHAFEVFADAPSPRAAELCDWCESVALEHGALPFARGIPDPAGCAPFWVQADPQEPSLQITAIVAATAHRAGLEHPWLTRATDYCRAKAKDATSAMAIAFAAQLFDAAGDDEALHALDVPADGVMPVQGGRPGEAMRPLDFAPSLFAPEVVEADKARLAAEQQPDGGWITNFDSYSPAAALEWRGHMTVKALQLLA